MAPWRAGIGIPIWSESMTRRPASSFNSIARTPLTWTLGAQNLNGMSPRPLQKQVRLKVNCLFTFKYVGQALSCDSNQSSRKMLCPGLHEVHAAGYALLQTFREIVARQQRGPNLDKLPFQGRLHAGDA